MAPTETGHAVSLEMDSASTALIEKFATQHKLKFHKAYVQWLARMNVWFVQQALLAFDNQKQTGGSGTYPELSPAYAARKARAGRSPLANIWSGALRRSISSDVEGYHLNAIGRTGSTAYYAAWIQEGTRRNLPPRPFLPTIKKSNSMSRNLGLKLIREIAHGK